MIYAYFTLFVALTISVIAEYYSIIGLTTLFPGSFLPIVIMGASLGIGKITAAVWLKINWHRASITYKLYLVPAVVFLMFLTSIGCFGYLSKAHSDQSLVSGDVAAKIAVYDEKIKIAKENIDTNRKVLKQLDESVDQVMNRSQDERGADKAVALRRNQQKERGRLLAEIQNEQKIISQLNEEAAPIRAKIRQIENETGPLKYVAALIYGDNPDANLLESAVRWVIILIVLVFDPLALVLILAAQQSMRWEQEEEEAKEAQEEQDVQDFFERAHATARQLDIDEEARLAEEANLKLAEANQELRQEAEANYEPDDGPLTPDQYAQIAANAIKPATKRRSKKAEQPVEQQEPQMPSETEDTPKNVVSEPQPEIKTVDVTREKTLFSPDAGYVWWEGKQTSIEALRGMRPDLIMTPERAAMGKFIYGSEFPVEAVTGDLVMRTDVRPHRLYKFNGTEWIQVNKDQNTSYLGNQEYLQYLISSLNDNRYLPEMLTEQEEEEIWRFFNQQPTKMAEQSPNLDK